jgi:hypothetical protein
MGSDPIPAGAIADIGLPSAVFSTTIGSPITDPAAATDVAFDTVQTDSLGATYFSIVSGNANIAPGFYYCLGVIHFAAVVDWHTLGPIAQFATNSGTLGAVNLGESQAISIAGNPTYINQMVSTTFVWSGSVFGVSNTFQADGITTLPSGIAVSYAVVVRIGGGYTVLPP